MAEGEYIMSSTILQQSKDNDILQPLDATISCLIYSLAKSKIDIFILTNN